MKKSHVGMLASLRSIAEKSGLSINSVSNILNRGRDHLYKKQTVDRVKRIAEEAGYRRNLAARMLLSNTSRMIGFVTLSLENSGTLKNAVVYPFLVGATDFLADHNYHIVLVPVKELLAGPELLPQVLREHFFDALILQLGPWHRLQESKEIANTPILHWDSGLFAADNCLHRDELEVGRELTRKLISLGHRRIALAMTVHDWEGCRQPANPSPTSDALQSHFSVIQRHAGYVEALREARLEPIEIVIGTAVELADRLYSSEPSAVVLLGTSAYGPFESAARRLGWSIPERLTVASCDIDPRVQSEDGVKIGGFLYDRYAFGLQAGEMLLALLQKKARSTPSRVVHSAFRLGETIIRPATHKRG